MRHAEQRALVCMHCAIQALACRGSQAGRSPLAEIPMGRVPPRSHVPLVGDLFDFQQDDSAAGSQSRPLVTSAHLAQVRSAAQLHHWPL